MPNNLYHTWYEKRYEFSSYFPSTLPISKAMMVLVTPQSKKKRKIPQACTFRHQIARGMAPTLHPIAQSINASHIWAPSTQISQITLYHSVCNKIACTPAYMNKECIFRQCTLVQQLYWCVLMCIHVYCCVYLCVWQLYWWHEWVHKESAPSIEYSQTLWGGFFPIRQRRVNVAWALKKSSDF